MSRDNTNSEDQLSYLYVTDPEALNHILTNGYVYTKPSFARQQVANLWGPGNSRLTNLKRR